MKQVCIKLSCAFYVEEALKWGGPSLFTELIENAYQIWKRDYPDTYQELLLTAKTPSVSLDRDRFIIELSISSEWE